MPLTTGRRRLGTLILASKQPSTYEEADAGFLRLVANQVAVTIGNALAFQEIEALDEQLSQANPAVGRPLAESISFDRWGHAA